MGELTAAAEPMIKVLSLRIGIQRVARRETARSSASIDSHWNARAGLKNLNKSPPSNQRK